MVVKEILNEQFVRHYSDRGMKLKQVETGVIYDEAVDLIPCPYTYEETYDPVEQKELADAINALHILGVE